jgi:hypothetical protein
MCHPSKKKFAVRDHLQRKGFLKKTWKPAGVVLKGGDIGEAATPLKAPLI